jgi:hypothetical protein
LELLAVYLKGRDAWMQLLTELPELLKSLHHLSFNRLFNEDIQRGIKGWNTFPRLAGESALRGLEAMGFELYMGKHRLKWKVMGVTYSGRDMGKAFDFIVRSSEVIPTSS